MLDSCFFLLRIVYDADQGRTEKPIADTVSAANLFEYFVVGKVVAINTLERLVHARRKWPGQDKTRSAGAEREKPRRPVPRCGWCWGQSKTPPGTPPSRSTNWS